MSDLTQHPAYHEGFYDAQDGEPIWLDECSREYAAGWLAFWDCWATAAASPPQTSTGDDNG